MGLFYCVLNSNLMTNILARRSQDPSYQVGYILSIRVLLSTKLPAHLLAERVDR